MLDDFGAGSAEQVRAQQLRKVYRKQLVKRSEVLKIAAAWVVTVPASALLGALFYYAIFGMVHSRA